MHLTCRKDRIHNYLQAKKNEDLFQRTSDDSLKTKNNMMILSKKRSQTQCIYVTLLSDIIDEEPSKYEEEREGEY